MNTHTQDFISAFIVKANEGQAEWHTEQHGRAINIFRDGIWVAQAIDCNDSTDFQFVLFERDSWKDMSARKEWNHHDYGVLLGYLFGHVGIWKDMPEGCHNKVGLVYFDKEQLPKDFQAVIEQFQTA